MKITLWMELCKGVALALAASYGLTYCHITRNKLTLGQRGDSLTVIHITNPANYMLLPIEEEASESQVLLHTGGTADTDIDIRLAQNRVDYFVPSALPGGTRNATVRVRSKSKDALCRKEVRLSDTLDTTDTEKFRPVYHHTPLYGWMNDANELVYKNGEYHLYFQYNPYSSKQGNMHQGHSVNKDLVRWKHLEPAVARDTLGYIFSSSSVVDQKNVAGHGARGILAFYTSTSDKNGRIQYLALSKNNGRAFTKYEKNPILRSSDGLKDFRNPKVFRYEPEDRWVMIVSANKKMRFYDSKNLKDWDYMSSFGEGYGVQFCQFECPDMVELSIDGDTNREKQALIVSVNPGYYFGGSTTQYFTRDFDGTRSICDSQLNVTKWLDWDKDHYATVYFSSTGSHVVAVPWVNDWQYCNIVPTKQLRSTNALPRRLNLYVQDGEIYLSAAPILEIKALRKEKEEAPAFTAANSYHIDSLLADNDGAYELVLEITAREAEIMGFSPFSDREEKVDIYLNLPEKGLVVDRTKSNIVDFEEKSVPHEIGVHDRKKTTSINYIDGFALAIQASIRREEKYVLDIFVNKCSVEIFLNGGEIATTNPMFPSEPYNRMCFYDKGDTFNVNSFSVC